MKYYNYKVKIIMWSNEEDRIKEMFQILFD